MHDTIRNEHGRTLTEVAILSDQIEKLRARLMEQAATLARLDDDGLVEEVAFRGSESYGIRWRAIDDYRKRVKGE